MKDWAKIEELTRLMCLLLLQRGAPQEAAVCSESLERAADDWLRAWCAHGVGWQPPEDRELLRQLLARFRYLTAHAQGQTLQGGPLPAPTPESTMELYLVDLWHRQFRARWLSGEKGVAVSDN